MAEDEDSLLSCVGKNFLKGMVISTLECTACLVGVKTKNSKLIKLMFEGPNKNKKYRNY